MLVELFAKDSATSAATFLASKAVSKAQRKELAQLAGMESAWIECDQAIAGNVADMAESLVTELYEPFWFYRASLRLEAGEVCRQLSNLSRRRLSPWPRMHRTTRHRDTFSRSTSLLVVSTATSAADGGRRRMV